MAANVAWKPVVGSLSGVVGNSVGHGGGGLKQRASFEAGGRAAVRRHQANLSRRLRVRAASETELTTIEGVVFEPFRELQDKLSLQPSENPQESLARQRYAVSVESALNDQINVEYNASYIYHTLFAYFDRDNVGLPGLAKFFKESSDEERGHAEKFMQYQNKRGGRVKLLTILSPLTEFANDDKSDALFAMELTLSLEKLTTEKLYGLHDAAEEAHDLPLGHLVRSEYLSEQVESIKKISEYVAQLRRIGNDGHGVVYWDRLLLEDGA